MLLQTVTISRQALLLASPHTCSRCMSILCKRQMPQIMRQYQARLYGSSVSAPTLYRLRSRGLIRLAGRDVVPLLQGLLTNDVTQLMPAKSHYSMMLNVQGRVMYDLLLYNVTTSDSETMFLMEFDSSHTDRLMAEIKKYKIRKKVAIDTVDDLTVLATISEGGDPPIVTDSIIQTDDPRVPSFGSRIVVGSLDMAAVQETEAGYQTRRLQWGIAEGSRDLPPGNCFPLESNLAYMNGVSFSKGCYLGQELTARTHHTGATRKRIMPLLFERSIDGLEFEEIVRNSKGKNVGKLRSTQGIYGIALLRMAEVAGTLTVNTKAGETISLTTTPPDWWPK